MKVKFLVKVLPVAVSVLCGSAWAASITLVPSSTNVQVGDTVTVDIVMDFSDVYTGGNGTVGGGLDVTFDNSLLTYGSYAAGSTADSGFRRNPDVSGNKLVGIAAGGLGEDDGTNSSPALGATDTIGTLTFTAADVGTATLSAADNVSPAGGFYSFQNQPISVTYNGASIEVASAVVNQCKGDLDGDFDVDVIDVNLFVADFGKTAAQCSGGCLGDLDGDNDVDVIDVNLFVADFGKTSAQCAGS